MSSPNLVLEPTAAAARAPMIGLVFGTADLCDMLSAQAHAFGVGYRMTSDHRLAACCDELVADPGTRALAIGIDQLADGPAFFASADRARAAGKPVVLHSFDRFDRFERPGPAISVTSLEAACETHGILFVEHGLDLIPLAAVLAATGPLGAEGIGIAADSSRAAEMITRLLIASGVGATTLAHATSITALASDPSIGVVLDLGAAAKAADSIPTRCAKPVIRIDADAMSDTGTLLPGNAHSAVRIAVQLARDYRRRRAWRPPAAVAPLNDATIALLAPAAHGPFGEHLTKRILASAGVAVTREGVARSPYEAAQIAREVRYPVAMKAEAQGLTNRHSIGAIELGLTTPDEVFEAFRAIEKAVNGRRGCAFEGCLVQEMIEGPIELLVATHWNPSIGAMLEVGFGGKLREILDDRVIATAPVDEQAARAMLGRLRGAPLLRGERGQEAMHHGAIAVAIVAVSQLAAALGARLSRLTIDPLIVSTSRAVVADARLILS